MKTMFYPFLWLLSLMYGCAVKIRHQACTKNQRSLPRKTICVGNITTGGTGKTPAVIMLARLLLEKGRKIVILSRGYKRKSAGTVPLIVSNKEKILVNVEISGDEPYLIARNLPGIPVIVCPDRFSSGKNAIEKFNPDIILLDDGFQHCRLFRDLDVVLVDCLNPFGGNKLLPLGFLREPLSAFGRAGVILLTNSKFVDEGKIGTITSMIKKYNQKTPIIKAGHKPVNLEKILTRETIELAQFKGKEVVALSSIGNPASFEKTLQSLDIKITESMRYPDHYWYSEEDVKKLSEKYSGRVIVTTEKDAVRLEAKIAGEKKINMPEIYILKIELEIESIETLEREINKVLKLQ